MGPTQHWADMLTSVYECTYKIRTSVYRYIRISVHPRSTNKKHAFTNICDMLMPYVVFHRYESVMCVSHATLVSSLGFKYWMWLGIINFYCLLTPLFTSQRLIDLRETISYDL